MKRSVIAIFVMMISVSVFAFTPTQNNNLNVLGYYDPTENSSVRLSVYDYEGSQLFYASNVQVSSDHLGSAEEVFNWEFEGNLNGVATVKFTFSEMQAYLNNKYYRPAYTIAYVLNSTQVNGSNVSDGFSFNSSSSSGLSNSKISKTKTTQSYMFEGTSMFVFKGTRNNNNNATWIRSGYFTLNITDYDNVTGGEFKYRCNVTVEYEAL